MIRKINEKARKALRKSLMIGGALLFVTAVAGCDESTTIGVDNDLGASLKAMSRAGRMLGQVRTGVGASGGGM